MGAGYSAWAATDGTASVAAATALAKSLVIFLIDTSEKTKGREVGFSIPNSSEISLTQKLKVKGEKPCLSQPLSRCLLKLFLELSAQVRASPGR